MASKENKKEQEPIVTDKEKKEKQRLEEIKKKNLDENAWIKEPLTVLKQDLYILEKGITSKDIPSIQKLCKNIRKYKRHLKAHHFEIIFQTFNQIEDLKDLDFTKFKDYNLEFYQKVIDSNMKCNLEINNEEIAAVIQEIFDIQSQKLPKLIEVQIYLQTLFIIYLGYNKYYEFQDYEKLIKKTIQMLKDNNKRYFDILFSFIYFYYHQLCSQRGTLKFLRDELYEVYRTSCLHQCFHAQSTLLNLLLNNYLSTNAPFLANHLLSKTNFPPSSSTPLGQHLRYLFYTAKLFTFKLQYTEAYANLMQITRKFPSEGKDKKNPFILLVWKWIIIVGLLIGEIPNKAIFEENAWKKELAPYGRIVRVVIQGNMAMFKSVLAECEQQFAKDQLLGIVNRLKANVIKTGLKRIEQAYSRIQMKEVKEKLQLEQGQDIEFILAKAIRDGAINATIDHSNQVLEIQENKDLYSTDEPMLAYQKRIQYCIQLFNASRKALQFPEEQNIYVEMEKPEFDADEILRQLEELL